MKMATTTGDFLLEGFMATMILSAQAYMATSATKGLAKLCNGFVISKRITNKSTRKKSREKV
jgi:hypothetical protein